MEDVLSRYWEAAKLFDADVVIRVTSDNPLVDPELIGQMLGEFEGWSGGNLDYLSNNLERSFPYGLDIEVFPVRSLERAHGDARDRFEREHVTPYLRRHPELFALANFKRKGEDLSWLRWTLDTLDDFEFISAVYEALWQGKSYFSTQSVLDLLSSRPELVRVNS